MSKVIKEIAAERQRQIEQEGWSIKHDDQHVLGELIWAAAGYVTTAAVITKDPRGRDVLPGQYKMLPSPSGWPWHWSWWKPQNPRRDLIRAAALIVAEIERLDRADSGVTDQSHDQDCDCWTCCPN